ncbi:MAG: caspase family protein [Nostoc sp. CmiVER01]|uniref:caspase family protein n=1 Tax=Nostoc sp. CmiVER01 TaxID=3075384 RepID=UPI002AD36269|nr:caspase family protein [Nostoc sp. CmiVER01]MDZ8126770.1 caspase family protein [Nostoc sp. CmiVER01]
MSRDALVVGINKYPFLKDSATGNYKHLTTPATDAEAIAQLLETHGNFRVKRFPASNIDGKLQVEPDKLVKTEELEAAILDLFLPESGKPPETALLFFAGHGLRKQLRQSLTQGFLATSDASPSKNLWGLSLRELWDILQQSQVQQQVIWLDCCFSGELLNFKDTELGRHSSGCDRFLIAASRDYEVAYQQLDGKHGVLTGAILAGLNPDQVSEDEWITNRTLAVSVEQNLQRYYDLVKIPQSSLISNHGEVIKLIQGRAKHLLQNQPSMKNSQNLKLESNTINELVNLLQPFLENERDRHSFLVLALGTDAPVLQHIDWSGSVATFAPLMLDQLVNIGGEQAFYAVLEHAKSQVGTEVKERINKVIDQFNLSTFKEIKIALSDCSSDLQKLQQESDYVLENILINIGGFNLPRTDLIANAQKLISEASLIEIVGSSGVGKSALLKTLVEYQRKKGQVLVLSGDRITGTSWSNYAGSLQIQQPLNKLLLALSRNTQPTIFIDGIDRIGETGKQAVVKDLFYRLAEVPLSEEGSRHWTVIFTAQEENLREVYKWLNWQALGEPTRLQVPELTQAELQSVVEHIPRLKPLLSLSQLSPILKNPLMLRLLEDPRMLPNPEDLPPIATEIEVSNVWWSRVVIGQNLIVGEGREQILISLGEKAVKSPGTRLRIENAYPEAVVSLKQDRILIQDPDRRLFRFGHDLLEDWVMLRVLNEYRDKLPAYLKELGEPFGLLRSVQLVGVSLLENHATSESWINLIEQIEQASELSPRWRQALLTAPLVSPRSSELLDKAEPLLIADNARRLIELLVAVRTLEVMPNFSLMFLFTEAELKSSDRVMPILMSDPIPRWSVWQPFMGWLLKRINDLPTNLRPEVVKLMEIWQVKSPTGSIYRKEIGEIASAWLKEQEASRGW